MFPLQIIRNAFCPPVPYVEFIEERKHSTKHVTVNDTDNRYAVLKCCSTENKKVVCIVVGKVQSLAGE